MKSVTVATSQRQCGPALVVKRALDIIVSAVLLIVLSPVLAVVACAIKVGSPGPVLYRQQRIGRMGRPFTMLKFRSMSVGADEELHQRFVRELLRSPELLADAASGGDPSAPTYKLSSDPRVTPVGAVIRRLSIDELPQLVNVLKGEMSLVGPRPDVPYSVAEYEPWAWRRFEVLPGLTGLWQVSGRGAVSPIAMLQLDIEYVDRWSLLLDLRLLLATAPAVLRKVGSA
jgi:lipopolysaccharide/colanic/teichoic acid biosynthesis glycosyltransferase